MNAADGSILDIVSILLRICLPIRLVCIVTICLAKICRVRGIVNPVLVLLRIDLSISLMCIIAIRFS